MKSPVASGIGLTRNLTAILLVVFLASPLPSNAGSISEKDPLGYCYPPGIVPRVTGPSPRRGVGMANDAAHKQVVLFGGWDGVSNFADTWTWDGSSWTEQHPASSPSPRRSMSMTYDASRREVLLFGGTDGTIEFGDTWLWDGSNWTQQEPAHSPTPRSNASIAFDASTRRVLVHGGVYGEYFTTWLWDGLDWDEVHHGSPADRLDEGMARVGNRVLMFGGEKEFFEDFVLTNTTFVWDGTSWLLQRPVTKPSPREFMGMAYDVSRDEVVMFGGNLFPPKSDTWIWDGINWTRSQPTTSPKPRARMGMTYDSARRQVVLFGGTRKADQCFFGDTWTWDGVTWTEH